MEAGRLSQRVTLLSPSRTTDAFGAQNPTFDEVSTRWAEVAPVSAREQIRANRVEEETTYVVRMRPYADVQSDWRIAWKGRTLLIDSLIRRPRTGDLELITHEANG